MRKFSGILATTALVASVVLLAPAANAAETITGSGSSYMNSIQQACSAAYTTDSVTYTSKGSGTGKTEFASGATQFGGTDSLYSSDSPSNFTYVPLIGGPIGVLYNVKGLTSLNLTPKLVSDIFTGKITKWNDAAIKAVNVASAAKLPAKKIQVVYRSDDSGTTNNFARYMDQTVGGKWQAADSWSSASGSTLGTGASKNAGIVTTMKTLAFSIGYADLADAKSAGIPFAALKNGAGQFVKPTVNASKLFLAANPTSSNGEVVFDYKKAVKGGYNLSLVAYGIAPTKSANAAKAAAVKAYFTYFLNTCSPAKAAGLNYVALSGALKTKALALVAKIK
jgi:phosphate transport system substrate-binding protein